MRTWRLIDWLFAFLATASILCAADQCLGQSAVIEGPDKSAPGDLVVLDATKSDASDFAWRLVNSDKSFLAVEAGRKVVFASGKPGIYSFVLAVAKADKVALAQHDVTIGEPKPPGPEPLPPSPPNPPTPTPLPPGKYGLATLARDWALTQVPASASRAAVARSLASSFRSIAAAIAAGTETDARTILKKTKESNQAILAPADRATWLPFFRSLQVKLDALIADKSLVGVDDYQAAWTEIAGGLEVVQ